MFSIVLKNEIELIADQMPRENLFFTSADAGTMQLSSMKFYLNNIFFLFKQTTLCLDVASKRSLAIGEPALADFFAKKISEEIGHDQWARQDLENLGTKLADVDLDKLSTTLKGLVSYIYDMIQENPKRYLVYMFFAEYFTVLVVPKFLDDLEKKCQISRLTMSALNNHAELDKDHAQEDLNIIDQFIGNPDNTDEYFEVVRRTTDYIGRFFTEVASYQSKVCFSPETNVYFGNV